MCNVFELINQKVFKTCPWCNELNRLFDYEDICLKCGCNELTTEF